MWQWWISAQMLQRSCSQEWCSATRAAQQMSPCLPTEQSAGRCRQTTAFCQGAGKLQQSGKWSGKKDTDGNLKNNECFPYCNIIGSYAAWEGNSFTCFLLTTKYSMEIAKPWSWSKSFAQSKINKLIKNKKLKKRGERDCSMYYARNGLHSASLSPHPLIKKPTKKKNQVKSSKLPFWTLSKRWTNFQSEIFFFNNWQLVKSHKTKTKHFTRMPLHFPVCLKMWHGSHSCSRQALFLPSPHAAGSHKAQKQGRSLGLRQPTTREAGTRREDSTQLRSMNGSHKKKKTTLVRRRREEPPCRRQQWWLGEVHALRCGWACLARALGCKVEMLPGWAKAWVVPMRQHCGHEAFLDLRGQAVPHGTPRYSTQL